MADLFCSASILLAAIYYASETLALHMTKWDAPLLSTITIVSFGVAEAEEAAKIRSILKTAGTPIGAYDVMIASTALTHNHILVTSNIREFQRVPRLQIENWRSA